MVRFDKKSIGIRNKKAFENLAREPNARLQSIRLLLTATDYKSITN